MIYSFTVHGASRGEIIDEANKRQDEFCGAVARRRRPRPTRHFYVRPLVILDDGSVALYEADVEIKYA